MAYKTNNRVPMYHPWKRDRDGNRSIQMIHPKTANSGKAALMGYLPVPVAEAPPVPVKAEPIEAKVKVTKAPKSII